MTISVTDRYRVSADIGGTFTDIVVAEPNGSSLTRKVLSTPDDYSRSIVEGLAEILREAGIAPRAIEEIVHGTTIATNAIVESKGALTGLLTTKGFRDVLELRRLRVPQLYNLAYKPPTPMVERRLRMEIGERMDGHGQVVEPMDEESVVRAVERMKADGVQAIAVCLLHSYQNPAHEHRVGEIVRELMPEAHLSLSVDILPEIREYERTSTTVINAYIGPTVRSYLDSLETQLTSAGVEAPLRIMQSNGGVMSAHAAGEKPAHIVESGPAAGVIAAQVIGERAGLGNLITFDMGGTTAKASIIEDGKVSRTTEYEVGAGISLSSRLVKGGGHALKLPVLDIAEVGAGGGSVVWIDSGRSLKVGPQSAGADPGPACYGRGGAHPTVTDANVVLGYINPIELAGGTLSLQPALAERAIAEGVAAPLGMALLDAAFGVHSVVNANMIRAIKAVSTYRGRDPRDFALLAFGGSGPVHAAAIASELRIRQVIIPPAPGLFSAVGLLEAQTEHHFVRTFFGRVDALDLDALSATYADLRERAERLLEEERGYGGDVRYSWLADLRYVGQAYELTVPVATLPRVRADVEAIAELFGQEHERTYGHRAHDEPAEFVNVRLVARSAGRDRPVIRALTSGHQTAAERRAYFGRRHGLLATPVVSRVQLDRLTMRGPLVIEDYDATTLVPPSCTAELDANGNILMDVALGVD